MRTGEGRKENAGLGGEASWRIIAVLVRGTNQKPSG
jgi:hypothetical protein